MFFVIAGLGNPGRRYSGTRHNAGFAVVERLAAAEGWNFGRRRFSSLVAEGRYGRHHLLLLQPQTFMNLSGQAVAAAVRFYRLPLKQLAVVHDDVDLEVGRLQLRRGGGTGGHRGLDSIVQSLGGAGFVRLRVGAGRPEPGVDTADHVLAPLAPPQQQLWQDALARAVPALKCWLDEGLEMAMNRYNPWPVKEEKS
ncbi:MAG: aminoacyl-tRNA hydrolase [Deltaproteobacteria bacterium]|nr:MAG: aminoacyl-tRNA hydrolase [Deltaproteobacteria bacterium]